jgi:hypothetical protein
LSEFYQAQCTPDFFVTLAQVMRDRIKMNPEAGTTPSGENLRDSVVREILQNIREKKPEEINIPLKNLAAYVETVHHTGYSDSLIACELPFGLFPVPPNIIASDLCTSLTQMANQMAEWKSTEFDANPLLRICSLVSQHHKAQNKVSCPSPLKHFITSDRNYCCKERGTCALRSFTFKLNERRSYNFYKPL